MNGDVCDTTPLALMYVQRCRLGALTRQESKGTPSNEQRVDTTHSFGDLVETLQNNPT